jgi:hypothetical protein
MSPSISGPLASRVCRKPPMTDQTVSTVATLRATASAASSGMILLVRYLRVRRA